MYFLDVKHSLLHLLGHCEGYLMADLTEKQLQLKEDTARCILNVANKVIPGTVGVKSLNVSPILVLKYPF